MRYPVVEMIPPATEGGNFAVKVNGIFAVPAPNQPAGPANPVDPTGGFTGTPIDQAALPFDINKVYNDLAEPKKIAEDWNAKGLMTVDVIQSSFPDPDGKPRFQLSGRSALRGTDWHVVYLGITGPAPATNVAAGVFNVWSQDQADHQGQPDGEAERGRPFPGTGTGTTEPST